MKTVVKLFFLAVCLSLLAVACSKTDVEPDQDLSVNVLKSHPVTVPFAADFIGTYVYVGPDPQNRCGEFPPNGLIIVDGTGTATHLGNSTVHFEFCCDLATGEYGPTFNTYMVAANGDTLFLSCAGQVLPREPFMPPYVIDYWKDPFVIIGGTGRFQGATGGGWTDDYNSTLDAYSHHHWAGTITLPKGKN